MVTMQCYPGGKKYILTMSYDDGVCQDRRLIELFNQYGIKGTFHLNSQLHTHENRIPMAEYAATYAGHEISCHTCTHPFLDLLPQDEIEREIRTDRRLLEEVAGYPVYGMSYPYGTYNDRVIDVLRHCGIVYSRTTKATKWFAFPEDFMQWHPTCHHAQCLDVAQDFLARMDHSRATPLFYVWGHSYEFRDNNNWDLIERFCDKMAGNDRIWYATNMEIYRYHQAQKALVFSADHTAVYNPSAISVWLEVDGTPVEIAAGEYKKIK